MPPDEDNDLKIEAQQRTINILRGRIRGLHINLNLAIQFQNKLEEKVSQLEAEIKKLCQKKNQ